MINKLPVNVGWMSDSPTNSTGFATISKDINRYLTSKSYFKTYYLAHNLISNKIKKIVFADEEEPPFEVSGSLWGNGVQPYGRDIIQPFIKENNLDVFGILLDTFMLAGNPHEQWYSKLDTSPAKTIFYYPSDGDWLPRGCEDILRKVDLPVAMSKYAQQWALEKYGIQSKYIPHATHTSRFYPLDNKEELKKKYNIQDKFVIGSVYRNQPRKMPDRLFKAFAKFSKDKDDAVLLLHTDPYDAAAPMDSYHMMRRLGIYNKVLFTGMRFFNCFPYSKMNEVYNTMDAFILQTSGEGFGIPTIEAMACGLPTIVTDYTTTRELLLENGISGIPVKTLGDNLDHVTGSWEVERGITDTTEMAKAMQSLYENESYRRELGSKGLNKVRNHYSWEQWLPEWEHEIIKLIQ